MATRDKRQGYRMMGTVLLFTGAALFAAAVALAVAAVDEHGHARSLLFLVAGAFGFFGIGDLAMSAWARRRASL
ncbi:MAG: hypothetical protein M3Q23_01275 [Actinomycetota bacterium]|nr:hypothetical protein [Actinomycetota bacterium]